MNGIHSLMPYSKNLKRSKLKSMSYIFPVVHYQHVVFFHSERLAAILEGSKLDGKSKCVGVLVL